MNRLVLSDIVVRNSRADYYFSVGGSIQKYFKPNNHLFFAYNGDITDIPGSILAIPFVANVIPLIWITDSVLFIRELDRSFYECLDRVKAAYQNMFPGVRFNGKIVVDRIENNVYTAEHEAASLFSGGLDALTTFIRIREKRPYLITEYGWHEDQLHPSDVWEADKKHAVQFAQSHGLQNILIQSNYGAFIHMQNIDRDFRAMLNDSWWHGLHHGLAIISAAIPMAFKLKIDCIYIASSNTPDYPVACASDPTVDNEIRFASGKVFHDGFELTRQDKVRAVVEHYSDSPEPVPIRVCFKNEENCCRCEKCLRTLMGIMAEGHNPRRYGFLLPDHLSEHIKDRLNNEVKFFTDTFIAIYWKIIQKRMRENQENIKEKDLLKWFLDYDFAAERRKSLLKYRVTRFFPIVKRKISEKLTAIFPQNG